MNTEIINFIFKEVKVKIISKRIKDYFLVNMYY